MGVASGVGDRAPPGPRCSPRMRPQYFPYMIRPHGWWRRRPEAERIMKTCEAKWGQGPGGWEVGGGSKAKVWVRLGWPLPLCEPWSMMT